MSQIRIVGILVRILCKDCPEHKIRNRILLYIQIERGFHVILLIVDPVSVF